MINLSFDELILIAQRRNIGHYESKSKEDLIKVLNETKPETPKPKTPKPETTKTPKPKLEIRVDKKKLKKLKT